ncbi:DUF192 domain-containing protein, partial [Myxococcota bacterium]|nr:DUF192 domain-containing protein [Myxococcota bacterium]
MSAQSRIADPPITGGRPLLVVSALVAALAVAAPTCDEPSSSNSKTSEIVPEKPEEKQSLVTFLTSQSEVTFRVEVADDAEERRVGLMDRQEMAVDTGMIFVF